MKKILLLLSASFLLTACPPETIDPPVYDKDYGYMIIDVTEDMLIVHVFNGLKEVDIIELNNSNNIERTIKINESTLNFL